jgi:hypothetical protein
MGLAFGFHTSTSPDGRIAATSAPLTPRPRESHGHAM